MRRRSSRTLGRGWRLVLLLPGGAALLVGTAAGLTRLGVPLGIGPAAGHGLLLVLGFLGTLIALERAVAVGHPLGYVPVAASGAGALVAIAGQPTAAAFLLTAAGVGMVAVAGYTLRVQPSLHLGIMAIGALSWPLAAGLWAAGWTAPQLVGPLAAFLLLTIVGERLELSRLVRPPRSARAQLLVATGVFITGTAVGLAVQPAGWTLAGLGLLGQALWLVRHDIARRTVRVPGLPRYSAICLLTGYGWLTVAGVLWIWHGLAPAAFTYDAAVHAFFLGFVMSMVFGHAPIILPAVLRVSLPLRRLHYLPVVLLHTTLAVRVLADLAGWSWWREAGGVGNVAALFVFLAVTLSAVRAPRADAGMPA